MDWMDRLLEVYDAPEADSEGAETAEFEAIPIPESKRANWNGTVLAAVAGVALLLVGGAAWTVVTSGITPAGTETVSATTTSAMSCAGENGTDAAGQVVVDFQHAYWAGEKSTLMRTLAKGSPMRNEHWGKILPADVVPVCVEVTSSTAGQVVAKTTVEQPEETVVYVQKFRVSYESGDPMIVTVEDTHE